MPETEPNNHLTLGVWLEPAIEGSITGEGIYTLLCDILRSFASFKNTRVFLMCPNWGIRVLRRCLLENGLPPNQFSIISTGRRISPLIELAARRSGPKLQITDRLLRWTKQALLFAWRAPILGGLVRRVFATDSYILFYLTIILILPLIFPVALVWLSIRCALGLLGVLSYRSKLRQFLLRSAKFRKLVVKVETSLSSFITSDLAAVKGSLFKFIEDREYAVLLDKANRLQNVDVWYSVHAGVRYAKYLVKPKVVAVPDLVFRECPTGFHQQVIDSTSRHIHAMLESVAATISYSEFVRENHVVKALGVDPQITHVIRHAPHDLSDELKVITSWHGGNCRRAALALVRNYLKYSYEPPATSKESAEYLRFLKNYLLEFPFDECAFIFVSSQIRPHKNYHNLLLAYETLLRKRYVNVKFLFTGQVTAHSDKMSLYQYVLDNHLEFDVLSLPRLPRNVHAALYYLSALTVVPTLFEGGFPFPFSESLSVGTPVVMSDIPVVREMLPADLIKITLFDPYDVNAMADRIQWALENRQGLLEKQTTFHQHLCSRTWEDVSREYHAVFQKVANSHARASLRKLGNARSRAA